MTDGVVPTQLTRVRPQLRNTACVAAIILWIFFLLPPVVHLTTRYESIQSLQFGAFAFGLPVLLVIGAPWRIFGRAASSQHNLSGRGSAIFFRNGHVERSVGMVTVGGRRRAVVLASLYLAMDIFWRTASMVDFLARHPLWDVLEAVSFLLVGVALFLELVDSPPASPEVDRVQRFVTGAVIMWTTWIMAYLQGMSGRSWYVAFREVAGRRLSMANDQQLATFIIWLIAAAVFLPIIFGNVIRWLQNEERLNVKDHSFF